MESESHNMNKYYPPVHQVSSAPPAYIDGFPQQLNQTPTIIVSLLYLY